MKFIRPAVAALAAILIFPHLAFAGTISVNVSPSMVNSFGSFEITMTSSGMAACTWSRLDNGTVWQWKDQPLPGPSQTAYDSGTLSGWAGPAKYEWWFTCSDGLGGSYTGYGSIEISGTASGPLPKILVAPLALVFPDTPVGSSTDMHMTVENIGDAGSILSGALTFSGSPDFSCISGCSYSITTAESHDVVIRFTPSMPLGTKNTDMFYSGGGGSNDPAMGKAIGGGPAGVPKISVLPPYLDFGDVEIGDTRYGTFIVKNIGASGTLLSGAASVSGTDFSCYSGCAYSVPAGGSADIVIRFHPSSPPGTRSGETDFSGGGGSFGLTNGNAIRPTPSASLDFGHVVVGHTKTLDLTVRNPSSITDLGSGTLIVPAPFSCVGSCGYSLPPDGIAHFTITFSPTAPGAMDKTATLTGTPSDIHLLGNGDGLIFSFKER